MLFDSLIFIKKNFFPLAITSSTFDAEKKCIQFYEDKTMNFQIICTKKYLLQIFINFTHFHHSAHCGQVMNMSGQVRNMSGHFRNMSVHFRNISGQVRNMSGTYQVKSPTCQVKSGTCQVKSGTC